MMEKIQAWIEKHLVPVINKITSNFWFGIVADAVLFIVPSVSYTHLTLPTT